MNETAPQTLSWKWYTYGPHPRYDDSWIVINEITKREVSTSTESACVKIIELAYALKTGQPKPLNQSQLEKKAKHLENIPIQYQHYWDWNGRKRSYNTINYESKKRG